MTTGPAQIASPGPRGHRPARAAAGFARFLGRGRWWAACALPATLAAAPETGTPLVPPQGEHYLYQSDVLSGRDKGARESLRLSFVWAGTNIECRSIVTATNVREVAVVTLSASGNLLSAEQTSSRRGIETVARVSVGPGEVRMTRTENGKESVKRSRPPDGLPVLCDLAVLTFLRAPPAGPGAPTRVFLADYAQRAAAASVRQEAEETVTVPAGTFRCRRMALTIETPFRDRKILYWIANDPPHFVVRHKGVRGASTPEYATDLVQVLRSQPDPDAPAAPSTNPSESPRRSP